MTELLGRVIGMFFAGARGPVLSGSLPTMGVAAPGMTSAFARRCLLGLVAMLLVAWAIPARAAGGGTAAGDTTTSRVLAWGLDTEGQLGNGHHNLIRDVPARVKLPKHTKVTALAGGNGFSLALTSTGKVLAWGYDGGGQLGNGKFGPPSDVPVNVKLPKGTKVIAVAAGGGHSLAVTSTGKVLAWGYGKQGELGNGATNYSNVPVKVKLPAGTKVTAVAAGDAHSLALTSTGKVLAWGFNDHGQLGDGARHGYSDVPVNVKLPHGIKVAEVAAGGHHSLALTSTGRVLAWGGNRYGQLGTGHRNPVRDLPVKVKLPAGTKVTAVAAGFEHSLALTSTGRVLAWGYNHYGQLGDGSTKGRDVPTMAKLPHRAKVTALTAGYAHSLALTSTGALLAWGLNHQGQLGDGTTKSEDRPVKVKLPRGDVATALGAEDQADHSLAVVHPT